MPGMRVAVIGAGVCGMAAAIRLAEAGHDVAVYDPAPVAGGLASGVEVGDATVERFYHHLFRSDAVAARWITSLGLGERLHFFPASMGFYSGGRLYPFGTPASLLRFTPLPLRDRVALGLRIMRLSSTADATRFEHLTAVEWLRQRASREELEVFWHPLLRAKFGRDSDLVSMAWLWARFRSRVGGSVGRQERLGYLRGGFHALGEAMAARAGELGVAAHLGVSVGSLVVRGGAVAGVEHAQGEDAVDGVVWTPSLNTLARRVPELPFAYREACAATRYHGAIVVVVELARSALPYYWVTIGDANLPFTVAVEHTRLLPPEDYGARTIVYLGTYTPPDGPLNLRDDGEVRALFLDAATAALSPAFANPLRARVFRAAAAQPIVPAGWGSQRPPLRTGLRGLVTANIAQIYPWDRGINYSLELGEAAARALEADVA